MYAESAQILSQIVDISIDRLGAHMPIYESIDKIPEILYACGEMWSKMGLSGVMYKGCPITHISLCRQIDSNHKGINSNLFHRSSYLCSQISLLRGF